MPARFSGCRRAIDPCYGQVMRVCLIVVVLLAAACGSPRSMGGAVKPAPPGPLDLVRSVWGDYGGRCPGDYKYCKGHGQAVCCPLTSRCEEDSDGSYCASRTAGVGAGRAVAEPSGRGCGSDEIACSYRGQITCCASDQRCCTIDGAPSCCL